MLYITQFLVEIYLFVIKMKIKILKNIIELKKLNK